jgi:acetoin utilization deacetylase AcuC-like enzyme
MNLKIFGDTIPIDWTALAVKMPFAPMHELAEKYKLDNRSYDHFRYFNDVRTVASLEDLSRTFEQHWTMPHVNLNMLEYRIRHRAINTITALDQATPDTVCINLGGGMHHAGKYPNTGYAYSLINDICWAVDYQLEQGQPIQILDFDFHYGGGTFEYYYNHPNVEIFDMHHPKGLLAKHAILPQRERTPIKFTYSTNTLKSLSYTFSQNQHKVLLNIGTDWLASDPLFGKYGQMFDGDLLAVWTDTIASIVNRKIPLAITMGGGYSNVGLPVYEELISWVRQYEPAQASAS